MSTSTIKKTIQTNCDEARGVAVAAFCESQKILMKVRDFERPPTTADLDDALCKLAALSGLLRDHFQMVGLPPMPVKGVCKGCVERLIDRWWQENCPGDHENHSHIQPARSYRHIGGCFPPRQ